MAQATSPLMHWHTSQGSSLVIVWPWRYSLPPSKQLLEISSMDLVVGHIGLLVVCVVLVVIGGLVLLLGKAGLVSVVVT